MLDLRWEFADNGLTAEASVPTLDGDGITSWMAALAQSYRGWQGVRRWESVEHDACIEATHDGRGHVSLRFVLRGPRGYEPHAWEASVSVTLDAGEDMRRHRHRDRRGGLVAVRPKGTCEPNQRPARATRSTRSERARTAT